MKVYAIIGKDPNSDETYLSYSFKSDYYIEEREV